MQLKTKEKVLDIQLKMRLVSEFEEEVCGEGETLLTVIPSHTQGKGSIKFMAKMINKFQKENGNKLSIEECYDFLDEYFEENENKSLTDLYCEFLKEFDVRGIFEKGMGFSMASSIKKTLEEAKKEMEEMNVMEMMKEGLIG